MLRRAFNTIVARAAVAFAVGVQHLHPVPEGISVDLESTGRDLDVESKQHSPVLMALRAWNDTRVEAMRAGLPEQIYWEDAQVAFTIRSNKISGGARRGTPWESIVE